MVKKEKILINESKGDPCFVFIYNSLASTNETVRKKIHKYKQFAILARQQTKGRGRYNRTFLSLKDKGIYLTIGVEANKDLNIVSQYSVYIALAAKRVLEANGSKQIQIKWPNDLLINDKKCAGILSESVMCGDNRFAIVGIGINLFYSKGDFGELSEIATSVFSAEEIKTRETISTISKQIIKEFFKVCKEHTSDLYKEYCEACNIVGRTIEHSGETGEVISIEPDMSIRVNFSGEIRHINYGEIILQK